MKVLILNGSPHQNGDTSYIINAIKNKLPSNIEYEEINAYKDNIQPCADCRYCWENKGCSTKDKMNIIAKDDYDIVIIASPIYMSYVTPPLFAIITRLNYIWSNEYFLKIPNKMKNKRGILILTGGGDGAPKNAISIAKIAFKFLNASFDLEKDYIYSLNTNTIPAKEDKELINQIDKIRERIVNKELTWKKKS